MTQLSAMPTVSKLALHRETVMNLGGRRISPGTAGSCVQCSASCYCTVTCPTIDKHCTKKPGGCLA